MTKLNGTNVYDVLALRHFGTGHILNFAFVTNYDTTSTVLSSPVIKQIIINFIKTFSNPLSINNYDLNSEIIVSPKPSGDFVQLSGLSVTVKY